MVDERFPNLDVDVERGSVYSFAYNKNKELKGRQNKLLNTI